MKEYRVPHQTKIGHIHLTVSNLGVSLAFYKDLLGFEVTQKWNGAVFLSAGGYHHHIGLNTWNADKAQKPKQGHIGLYHFAIVYPDRKSLANILKRLIKVNYPLSGVADHGVSEAIYLEDPDGNGVELYTDRPRAQWPKNSDGQIMMHTKPLDIDNLLAQAE